jgi:peptidyl-dipeptidase Dcp
MPKSMLDRIRGARNFNQGFLAAEYLSAAILDLDLHLLTSADSLDVTAFEKAELERIGLPKEMSMRFRLPHASHIFQGGYYASGHYCYLWSEVMDADAFAAFEETGDVFDPSTARRLRDTIFAAGGRCDPMEAYLAFRGRPPHIAPMLKKRGFDQIATSEI